jgi:hypothetical protein
MLLFELSESRFVRIEVCISLCQAVLLVEEHKAVVLRADVVQLLLGVAHICPSVNDSESRQGAPRHVRVRQRQARCNFRASYANVEIILGFAKLDSPVPFFSIWTR